MKRIPWGQNQLVIKQVRERETEREPFKIGAEGAIRELVACLLLIDFCALEELFTAPHKLPRNPSSKKHFRFDPPGPYSPTS